MIEWWGHTALRELPDFSRYLGHDFDPHYLAQVKICPSLQIPSGRGEG